MLTPFYNLIKCRPWQWIVHVLALLGLVFIAIILQFILASGQIAKSEIRISNSTNAIGFFDLTVSQIYPAFIDSLRSAHNLYRRNILADSLTPGYIDNPPVSCWLYIDLDDRKAALFLDYLFPCSICPENTKYHLFRVNAIVTDSGIMARRMSIMRNINYSEYLLFDLEDGDAQ